MSGNDRLTQDSQDRNPCWSGQIHTNPSTERIWAEAHPFGFHHDVPPRTALYEQVLLWNFNIDCARPKQDHREYINSNQRFKELIQRVMVERRYFKITGRASSSGNTNSNNALSGNRALNIKDLLFGSPIFRAWNSQGFNPESLLIETFYSGSAEPIPLSPNRPEGEIDAYGRSVAIIWLGSCRSSMSREEIESIGRRYLEERTGWSIDSMTFWNLWTPRYTLFGRIVPNLANPSVVSPSTINLDKYKIPLSSYIDENHFFCTESEVKRGIDLWIYDVIRARDTKIRLEIELHGRQQGGGGGAYARSAPIYYGWVDQNLNDNLRCVFFPRYSLGLDRL